MISSNELRQRLQSIDHKSYPAYKALAGSYLFQGFSLSIDHVQGDPFAAPSRLSLSIPYQYLGFSENYPEAKHLRIALQDYLLRRFGKEISHFSFRAQGSGKSGLISISRAGQEVLERSACELRNNTLFLHFSVGFPANGRSINAGELDKILFDFLPKAVFNAFQKKNLPLKEIQQTLSLAQDQFTIREEMKKRDLVAFVAEGAILPRESGVSDKPMKDCVTFHSPKSLLVTLPLPNQRNISGMGIKKGITLIAGGGYHGKSTLLQALERGVYNHIAGDGREYVLTDDTALKLRAEDGRKISDVDISLFIRDLPNGKDTSSFSTLDASGSTSQAANIMEGIEAGSQLLLIDEDTSATNFMVRDELMQRVISHEKEPIIPFLERAKDLYTQCGISTILVAGSSGAYFYLADSIIQMDCYRPVDITERVKQLLPEYPAPALTAPNFKLPSKKRSLNLGAASMMKKSYRGNSVQEERLKVKNTGNRSFLIGKEEVDLRYVEQLVDSEQTTTLSYLLRYAKEHYEGQKAEPTQLVRILMNKLEKDGILSICNSKYYPSDFALPRAIEVFACLNRY
ncbi:MAG: ABC-ATPase domain-containing protein [bacterium]|nr:ABC-ATPase domain-containing protein [bacterium]